MKKMSSDYKLSRSYTNHCLRATSITLLDGYEARHVMTVSGHAPESSIRSYARKSDSKREKMAHTLYEAISGNSSIAEPSTSKQLVKVPQQVEEGGHDRELLDMDILELTPSQESIVQRHFPAPLGSHNTVELQHSQSHANYGAPVYNFSNSVVNIHHH